MPRRPILPATRPMRAFAAVLLSLLVALTSVGLGTARGQVMDGTTVVLCTGGAAVTVTLDSDGNPTGSAHVCPDMALALLLAIDAPETSVPAAAAIGLPLVPVTSTTAQSASSLTPSARGPPVLP